MSAGRIFYYLLAALIAGIALGSFITSQVPAVLLGLVALGGVFIFSKKNLVCVVFCALGLTIVYISVSHAVQAVHDNHTQAAAQMPSSFETTVTRVVAQSNRAILTVPFASTAIRISTYRTDIHEGDTVSVQCDSVKPDIYFPLAVSQGVSAECEKGSVAKSAYHTSVGFIPSVRARLLDAVSYALPSPEAELLQGLLLGKQAHLPPELNDSLRRTGTTHIVVLSGFNITIIAFVIHKLLRRMRVGLLASSGIGILCIWLFVFLAGFSPPTVRAALMVSIILFASIRGRPHGPIRALLFSATVLLIANPLLLRWSLSFQLSFLATLGVLLQDAFIPSLSFLPGMLSIRENIRTTLAATCMTLPLIIVSFGSVSAVAILANALILSLVPVAMGAGAFLLMVHFISPMGSIYLGVIAYVFLRVMTFVLETLATFPFAYIPAPPIVAGGVVALILFLFIWNRSNRKTKNVLPLENKKNGALFVASGIVVLCFAGFIVIHHPSHDAISFFDVGQGDAMLLEDTSGTSILLDAGPDETVTSRLGRQLSYFDRTIDVFILTHPHADHLAGFFAVAKKYRIGEVWYTGAPYDSTLYDEFLDFVRDYNIPIQIIDRDADEHRGSIGLKILWPSTEYSNSDLNQTSFVIRAELAQRSILLMGDAGISVEQDLFQHDLEYLQADVLKVGHHGSRTASSSDFLDAVHPTLAVISVGADNVFGHPNQQTLERLRAATPHIFRTDECGTVKIFFENTMRVQSRC